MAGVSAMHTRRGHREQSPWNGVWWSGDLPTRIVEYEPSSDRPEGKKELSQDWQEQRDEDDGGDGCLDERTGGDHTERDDAEDDEDEVLHIVHGPTMGTEGAKGSGGRVGCFEGGEAGGRRLSTSDLGP